MGFLVLIAISLIWFLIIDKAIQRKFKTPNRSWNWYKHDNKIFAVLSYVTLIAFIILIFILPEDDIFILFPFFGTLVNLVFTIEKYIYKKEESLYINYLSDAIMWFIFGVIAYIFFS